MHILFNLAILLGHHLNNVSPFIFFPSKLKLFWKISKIFVVKQNMVMESNTEHAITEYKYKHWFSVFRNKLTFKGFIKILDEKKF